MSLIDSIEINNSLFGYLIQVCQIKYGYAQVELLKSFGCKKYEFTWPQNENWLHSSSKYNIHFGSLSKVGRWKKGVAFDFKLCRIEIAQPNEAKCC